MIARTLLTEARSKVPHIRKLTQGIARDATYLTIALYRLDWAAEQLLDFPTAEMVEAMIRRRPNLDDAEAKMMREIARKDLEAVRRVMFGEDNMPDGRSWMDEGER